MQPTTVPLEGRLPCLATTAGVSAREKFGYWRDAIAKNLLDLEFDVFDGKPFEATFSGARIGAVNISTVMASPHRVFRTNANISRSGNDHILLNFVFSGRLVAEQDGRTAVVNVGESVACDARRPYSLTVDGPVEMANVRLSRHLLTHAIAGLQRITAVNLSSSGPLGPLAFTYLNGLMVAAARFSETNSQKVSDSFVELISGLLIDVTQGSPSPLSDHRNLALIRVKDFVERNLDNFELNSTMVAAGIKLSPRYINQLLRPEGTSLSRYIWRRRLEHAAADLKNPALKSISISSVALNNGFSDLSHFSKAFRDLFDQSPTEHRIASIVN